MKNVVDARGLLCPQPVVLTSKALAENDQVTTIVDNAVAVENVSRLAKSRGCSVEVKEKPDGIYVVLSKTGETVESAISEEDLFVCSTESSRGPMVLFVASDCVGRGSTELGERLMDAFFHTLVELASKPKTIIFMNSGINLAIEGSRAVGDLRELAAHGITILVCGTCLDYFGLTDKLAVGNISNMYDIANELVEAGKVVKL
jgi:selenium metabolism protein YedF